MISLISLNDVLLVLPVQQCFSPKKREFQVPTKRVLQFLLHGCQTDLAMYQMQWYSLVTQTHILRACDGASAPVNVTFQAHRELLQASQMQMIV